MKNKFVLKNRKGFSLVEIMISIVILAIMSLSIAGILINFVKMDRETQDSEVANHLTNNVIQDYVDGKYTASSINGTITYDKNSSLGDISAFDDAMNDSINKRYKENMSITVTNMGSLSGTANLNKIVVRAYLQDGKTKKMLSMLSAIVK